MGIVRELHVHDHYNGMIALLFAYEDGTVEAFDIHGLAALVDSRVLPRPPSKPAGMRCSRRATLEGCETSGVCQMFGTGGRGDIIGQ
jgi:hypothetical protein